MSKKVVVIGGGLGGLSSAIALASKGFSVQIIEKNERLGGKLNVLKKDGFSFDLGPSILTLPKYFEGLFAMAGKNMSDYVTIVPVRPHWRNFFEDGTVLDLGPNLKDMEKEIAKLGGNTQKHLSELKEFLAYSRKQYAIVERGYFAKGLDNLWDFLKFYGLFNLGFQIDHKRRMSQTIESYFSEPHLKDIFEYFIKYVGSSALKAPGFMNLMPTIQMDYDLWYVKGGLYKLAEAIETLTRELGVEIILNSEVVSVEKNGKRISSVTLNSGQVIFADYVVSNMEVIPTYRDLLKEPSSFLNKLRRFEPACSGLVMHLGTKKIYSQLAHHNFFYSKDQHKHFRSVFDKKELPKDPTIYLVAPTRTDPSQAPEGYDNLKILPHIPYLDDENPYTIQDYENLREIVLDKLERMGLDQLRDNIVFEDFWTPFDIQKKYYSNKGSIYGVASDWKKNYGFKAPKKCSKYTNLYFVGGSVNPGAGMPMVVLCGQNVANQIVASDVH
ncbi:MAG: phytoene desaturase [Bdellovibrionales bacterium]|nr:phytoene desaturase [Bdellovibrionales bacterium]